MTKRRRQAPGIEAELSEVELAFLWDEEPPQEMLSERWAWFALINWRPAMPRFNDEFRNPRDLWELLGDQLTAAWIEQKPGSRPSLWWRFVAPTISREPWMRVGDGDLHYGAPDAQTQLAFLTKHNLLTERERAALNGG